jgi:hypothetical protein
MKKVLSLCLIALLCLSLAACQGGNQGGNSNDNSKDVVITDAQVSGFAKVVELNETNWKNYFYIETVTEAVTNEFGEVVRTNKYYPLRVKTTDTFAYALYNTANSSWSDGVVIECNDTVANCPTMFTPTDEGYSIIDERERAITIDEFSFIRSSCKLILLDIPEEYWNTDENGDKYVCYQNEKIYKGKLIFEKNILNNIAP